MRPTECKSPGFYARPSPLDPVERYDCTPVPPWLATRQLLVEPVLYAQNVGERRLEPALGQLCREAEVVGRIGERDVVRMRLQLLHETHRVGAMDHRRLSRTERLGVGAQHRQAFGCELDEVDHLGAA